MGARRDRLERFSLKYIDLIDLEKTVGLAHLNLEIRMGEYDLAANPVQLRTELHQWWSRKPLPTARAVLFDSVVGDPSSHPEKFPIEEAQNAERERLFESVRELMQKKLHERPDVYAKAREEMLKHVAGKPPPVLDSYSGA